MPLDDSGPPTLGPLHRLWRLLPPRTRREALFTLTEWVAPRPAILPERPGLPVTVAGYFRAPSGLGEGARRLAAMLEAAGVTVHRADLTAALRQGPAGPRPMVPAGPGTLVLHVNGPLLPWALAALGRRAVAGKRTLAFWNWELPSLPRGWARGYRFVQGILAPSEFAAAAMRRAGGPPVSVVPYPVLPPDPAPLSRAELGLAPDAFVTLSVFDAASSVERKNPLAAIEAHRLAFGERPDRVLLLKTYNTAMGGTAWRAVTQAAAGLGNVRILDRRMTRQEVWGLIRLADLLLSLHRAEGYGLALAEAMALARPVVATAWSGNMDFMDDQCAMLVGHALVPAADDRGTYSLPGALWAEPEIGKAAEALGRLAADPALRLRLGAAGQRRVAALTPEACGLRARAAIGA